MQSITVTTPGARVVLRAGRYLDSTHRVGTVVGLDANPHRPYPLAVDFDGDDRGTRCVYPGDLALVWSAPVVTEVEPEHVEAVALATVRPDLATCRRQLLNVATAAAHDIINAGAGQRTYRTAAVFVGPRAGNEANRFLEGRFGQTYGILHQDSRGVFVADLTDLGKPYKPARKA